MSRIYTPSTRPRHKSLKARRYHWHKLREAGVEVMVDPSRALEHILDLEAVGVTSAMVAWRAGLTIRAIRNLRAGVNGQIRRDTELAILAVDHLPHPSQRMVPPTGAVRRVRALQSIGWTTYQLAEMVGTTQSHLSKMQHATSITYRRWVEVRDLFDRLSTVPGDSVETRKRAAAKGWLLPMEWEGYDIDDPRMTPPRSARVGKVSRSARRRDRLEKVAALLAQDVSHNDIADRLGLHPRQVARDVATVKGLAA